VPTAPLVPAFPPTGDNDDDNDNNCLLDFSGDDNDNNHLLDFGGSDNNNSIVGFAGYIYYNAYCIDY